MIAVAVPVPFLDLLTYSVPDSVPTPPVGARVRVPLGTRVVTGCVVQQGVDPVVDAKAIVEVIDADAYVPPHIVELCRWVADYYVAGIGDALALAMPPGARARASGFRTHRVAQLTAAGAEYESIANRGLTPGLTPLTEKQRAALEVLAATTSGLPLSDLKDRGVTAAVVAGLVRRGLVAVRSEANERDPFERSSLTGVAPVDDRQLTEEQAVAFDRLAALADLGDFRVSLLHGVTGSGKTEIYLRLARRVCAAGRRVLLMVPEIALTPSVFALFRGAFGARVAIQHSALSDGERHDQWQRIRRGDVDLVVGTRSAVFAPIDRLGLVIVDEEHDSSYKQEETPRYHGRDVAIVRAQREGALVVLGSATPSMETYQHAEAGKYASSVLLRRVLDRPLATVHIVNMRDEYAAEGPDIVISRPLAGAVTERLERQEQVIVLLNRRGYSTAVFCRQCGDAFDCPNCSISLTVHREGARHGRGSSNDPALVRGSLGDRGLVHRSLGEGGWRARCHYCNYSVKVPKQCRKCAAPYLEHSGFGTEKVEHHLREQFPAARIGRVDRDAVRRKGALAALLSQFAAGDLDILVGTQMIAKGHDFPRVTLVGVISADVGLGIADFRASERTFQLLTQVAGRAGRGERPGEAIVQTLYPEHYSIQLACRQDYRAFFEQEIGYRRAMRYPPMLALVNAIVRGRSFDEAMNTATDIVRRLGAASAAGAFSILGPAPAPLQRLRGEHRVQFFLKGVRRAEMRQALKAVLVEMPELRRRVTIDVDPLSIL